MNICSCKFCECNSLNKETFKDLTAIAKPLSSETKLKILYILFNHDHCVCEIEDCLGKEQSLISHHLSDLASLGWVKSKQEDDGRRVLYRLTKKGKEKLQIFLRLGGVKQ